VTPDDVTVLRRVYEQWSVGNFAAGRELLAPDIVSVWSEHFPTAGTYRGPGGHSAAMREWLSAWDDFQLEAEAFRDARESVVVPFRVRARGKSSGARVDRQWAHVWTFRRGKVVRFEVHLDIGAALAVVGLRE
jgi:ketosteroid isomerase-like protein